MATFGRCAFMHSQTPRRVAPEGPSPFSRTLWMGFGERIVRFLQLHAAASKKVSCSTLQYLSWTAHLPRPRCSPTVSSKRHGS
eukprot:2247998-Pyramimonas_sp.AAC.1